MDERSAISAALNCRWDEAVTLNNKIIKEDPDNIDALNRIAHAYFELGNLKLAKKFYTQVLKFDQYNPIATKNLKIIKTFKDDDVLTQTNHHTVQMSATMFLQEPGKTKVISLTKVAEPQKLSKLSCGILTQLVAKGRGLTVLDGAGEYVGVLPDDVAFHLLKLMKGGNQYEAYIKSIRVNGVSLFIRETVRSAKFRNQPSFLDSSPNNYRDLVSSVDIKDSSEEEVQMDEEETDS